ncbi:dethiobiotin synthase [Flavobacterium microcysteis]|uniref:ATP-dependent dethiobiotin synthetase BioD n=1 Tax=Flavobacterium microcysteis TaxID=2596891 RepID=A0A501Q7C0_9FLAO|nr:dethiobiotin synthase [Flavobacterium microcysteis]TPD68563.1 dethiobiotin synthase [Flavobacterium microcysteis]
MKIFVTGIGTDVGKTIASAIITESLEADYWKPIQAGDADNSDSHKLQRLLTNSKTKLHPNSYLLQTPASPHFAADKEGITIELEKIKEPKTKNNLVIEGAGGVFVPLNEKDTVIDLIQKDYKVVVVSRHYLGSINHTLLTIAALRDKKLDIAGIVFNGNENKATEEIILSKTGLKCIGRIEDEPYFDKNVIRDYADLFSDNLKAL